MQWTPWWVYNCLKAKLQAAFYFCMTVILGQSYCLTSAAHAAFEQPSSASAHPWTTWSYTVALHKHKAFLDTQLPWLGSKHVVSRLSFDLHPRSTHRLSNHGEWTHLHSSCALWNLFVSHNIPKTDACPMSLPARAEFWHRCIHAAFRFWLSHDTASSLKCELHGTCVWYMSCFLEECLSKLVTCHQWAACVGILHLISSWPPCNANHLCSA